MPDIEKLSSRNMSDEEGSSDGDNCALKGADDFQTRAWLHRMREEEEARPRPSEEAREQSRIWFAAIEERDLDSITKLLKENKKLVNSKDLQSGNTALHIAAEKDDAELLEVLIKKKANVSIVNNFGIEPIGFAAKGTKAFDVLSTALGSPNMTRRGAFVGGGGEQLQGRTRAAGVRIR